MSTQKPMDVINTKDAEKKIQDIKVYGNPDLWILISKASSEQGNWMKSTKGMNIPGGIILQVSTQVGDNVAEALTFVPNTKIINDNNEIKIVKG